MARKEEIKQAANNYKTQFPDGYINENDYIAGAEWADANPANYEGKAMLHVLDKGVRQGKRETLNKVCEWLLNNVGYYSANALGAEYMCEDLRKAMKE